MNALRLAVGTLTLLPVSAPSRVDGSTWRRAIALAPLVGLVLGVLAWAVGRGAQEATGSAFMAGMLVVVVLALMTRGLHLDGLADVADGLGSRRPSSDARAVMRRPDIGPFGVVTLLLTLLVQVAALQAVFAWNDAYACALAVTASAVVSRTSLVVTCRRGVPAASEGLAAHLVGSGSPFTTWLVAAAALGAVVLSASAIGSELAAWLGVATLSALGVGELWWRHCAKRLGAVTGDVLGSVEQLSWTTYLLVVVLLA